MKKIMLRTISILMTSQQLFAAQQGSALLVLFKDAGIEKHVCYERVYTQEELKNYSDKKAVTLFAEFYQSENKFRGFLSAKIKSANNTEDTLIENLTCAYSDADEKDSCSTERDNGGSIRIEARDEGNTLKLTNETIQNLGRIGEVFRLKKTTCSGSN